MRAAPEAAHSPLWQRFWHSLTRRMLVLSLGALVFGMFTAATLLYFNHQQYLRLSGQSELNHRLQQQTLLLEQKLLTLYEDSRFLSQLPAIQRLLQGMPTQPLVAALLKARLETEADYLQIRLLSLAPTQVGEVLAWTSRVPEALPTTPQASLPYVRHAIRMQPGQTYMAPIDRLDNDAPAALSQHPTLRLLTRIGEDEQHSGLLIVDVNIQALLQRLQQQNPHLHVVNKHLQPLLHPLAPQHEFSFTRGDTYLLSSLFPDLAQLPLDHPQQRLLNDYLGQSWLLHSSPLGLSHRIPMAEPLWLLQLVPEDELVQAQTRIASPVWLMLLGVCVLTAIIMAWLLQRQLRPLNTLLDLVHQLGQGQFQIPAPTKHHNEIAQIQQALHDMGAQLAARERELTHQQSLHQAIVDTSVNGLLTVSEDGILVSVNPAAARLFGYQQEEMLGQNINILVPEQVAPHHQHYIKQYLQNGESNIIGKTRSLNARHKAGHPIPVLLAVTETQVSGQRIFVAAIQDMSELHEAERLNEQLGRLMQAASNEIIVLNERFEIERMNLGALNKLQQSSEHLYTQLTDLLPEDEVNRVRSQLNNLKHTPQLDTLITTHFRRPDGSLYPVEIRAFVSRIQDQLQWVLIALDISEREAHLFSLQRYAQQLEASNKELQDFAYIASHDLQEPLRKVQTFSDRLLELEADNLSERGRDYLIRMKSAATRMRLLIEDLLALSRVHRHVLNIEPFSSQALVEEVLQDLELRIQESQAQVQIETLPILEGDIRLLRQVVHNLLTNALKFVPQGQHPQIQIKPVHHQHEEKHWIGISVADNGIGIDPHYHARIFTPLERLNPSTHYPGTGIGLAICQKIMLRHGGKILVDSQLGGGSCFSLLLPASRSEMESVSTNDKDATDNAGHS
ncbi:PAS domain S-box protein [Balneatrix alpica]|uniref:histidine kinase n=1 Tax=Balneatrix alpica TaxID=75684 RepID=A0ABV5ZEP7_9GAMM|nr:PAS domain S-box protein [Balneatrix alpica]